MAGSVTGYAPRVATWPSSIDYKAPRRRWRTSHLTVASLALLALALFGRTANAQEPAHPTARLEWVRVLDSEACPDAAHMAADVTSRLGYDPFVGEPGRVIDALIERVGAHWQARLFVRDATGRLLGTRTIPSEASDCSSLADAVALAISLAIDPLATLRSEPVSVSSAPPDARSSPSVSSCAPCAVAPTPVAPVAPRPIRPRRWDHRPIASIRAGVVNGLVPRVGSVWMLDVSTFVWGPFRIGLGAMFVPEQTTTSLEFGFGLATFSAEFCAGVHPAERVLLEGCATTVVGAQSAFVHTSTVDVLGVGEYVWAGGGLTAQARLRVAGPIMLEALVSGIAPFTRPPFVVTGRATPVFQQDPVGIVAGAGLAVSF